jgi:hypothetical protein
MRFIKLLQVTPFLLGAWLIAVTVAESRPQDAQSSDSDSVADAARRAREKKKEAAAKKAAKVIDDDDLAKRNYPAGQQGLNVGAPPRDETTPPPAQAVERAEADDKVADAETKKKSAEDDARIARLKAELAEAEKDLDLSQREFALNQDAYLSKTNYADDTVGKAKLDAEKARIADQQQEVESLKAKLAAAEEARKQRKPAAPSPAPADNEAEKPAPPPQI